MRDARAADVAAAAAVLEMPTVTLRAATEEGLRRSRAR